MSVINRSTRPTSAAMIASSLTRASGGSCTARAVSTALRMEVSGFCS